jgi:hypothetical protein
VSPATPDHSRPDDTGGATDPGDQTDPGPVPAAPSPGDPAEQAMPGAAPAGGGADPALVGHHIDPALPAAEPAPAGSAPWPPPPGMYPDELVPETETSRRLRPGPALAAGAIVTLVTALLGVPLGLLWTALAPSIPVIKVEGGAVAAQPQPEEFVAADGWFSLLGLGFGVLMAIVVWLIVRRYRGPVGLVAVGLGAIGASVVAWRVGRQIGLDAYHRLLESAPVGTAFDKPPDLRGGGFEWLYGFIPSLHGSLLLPAFGAVVMYTLLAGWSRWPTLHPEPEPQFSWDLAVPPAPQAAPAPPEPGAAEPPRG